MFLQQLLHHLNRLVELRIVSLPHHGRIEFHIIVRRNSVILYLPLAVQTVQCPTRSRDEATVEQFRIPPDTDESTPSLLPYQRPNTSLAEIPRQRIAAGAGHFIDDHHFRPIDGL